MSNTDSIGLMRRTVHKRTARRFLAVIAAGAVLAGTGLSCAAQADADPGIGCETIGWGIFGLTQKRTICDGPRRPDGSWERERRIWTPAGYVPRYTSCYYGCTSTGGYYRGESTQGFERYIVFDHNVVQGEPGWLPAGTLVLR